MDRGRISIPQVSVIDAQSLRVYEQIFKAEDLREVIPAGRGQEKPRPTVSNVIEVAVATMDIVVRVFVDRGKLALLPEHCDCSLLIAFTDEMYTSGTGCILTLSGKQRGNFYQGFNISNSTVTKYYPSSSDNGKWVTSELSFRLYSHFSTVRVDVNNTNIASIPKLLGLVPNKVLIERSVALDESNPITYAYASGIMPESFVELRGISVGALTVTGTNVFVKPTSDGVILRQDVVEKIKAMIQETGGERDDDKRAESAGANDISSRLKAIEEKLSVPVVVASEGIKRDFDKTETTARTPIDKASSVFEAVENLVQVKDLARILAISDPIKINISDVVLPQLMEREDAESVAKRLRDYAKLRLGNASDRNIKILVYSMIVFGVQYSTCWPVTRKIDPYVEVSVTQGAKGFRLTYGDLCDYLFANLNSKYSNPLRKFMRYFSTTTIDLLRRKVITPNYIICARYGLRAGYEHLGFDYLVLDSRFGSEDEALHALQVRNRAVLTSAYNKKIVTKVNTAVI